MNLIRATEAEVLADAPGSRITLLTDTATLTSNRATFEPGATGAPPHFHTKATEVFFVLSGRLDVLLDEEVVTLGEGDFLTVPPRVPHAFAPAAGSPADVLVTFTPGMDRFDYYRLLHRVNRGEADPREIRESQERYDNHYVDSQVWRV
ncbi:cupin domain-containing protein [Amycolatopsis thermoflava]|uniref:cupin domain-containing protein n=1 Tax=Amycolatopsis thermoflava TaxID=84480 RepID=UPI0004198D58|nr:cupin domain-containing protein [Amycolatopsis thermoflava]